MRLPVRSFPRIGLLGLTLVLCTACSEDGTVPAVARLEAPATLDFGEVWEGGSAERLLELRLSGASNGRWRVVVQEPFAAATNVVDVSRAGSSTVLLTFQPRSAGAHATELRLEGAQTVTVRLTGTGKAPPSCDTRDPCSTRRFDVAVGGCVPLSTLPDEAPCETPCIANGLCRSGLCQGAARSCDDGSDCTADTCDPGIGCVHRDLSTELCPAPDEPCRVARCDAHTGCGEATAPDGTSCGVADCSVTPVCRSGACVFEATPDGATCEANPCQPEGVCRGGVCDRPEPVPLAPAWEYAEGGEHTDLRFVGVTDEVNAVFWSECDVSCQLVSADAAGNVRWRAPLPGRASMLLTGLHGRLLLSGTHVISAETSNFLSSHDAADGTLEWSIDLLDVVSNGMWADWMLGTQYAGAFVGPMVDHGGVVVVLVRSTEVVRQTIDGVWVVAVEVATGRVLWVRRRPPEINFHLEYSAIGDEYGVTYFTEEYVPKKPDASRLGWTWDDINTEFFSVAMSLQGDVLWRVSARRFFSAAFDGTLLAWRWPPQSTQDLTDVSLTDGSNSSRFETSSSLGGFPSPVVAGPIFLTATPCPTEPCVGWPRQSLMRFDPHDVRATWTRDYSGQFDAYPGNAPIVTTRRTLLFMSMGPVSDGSQSRYGHFLTEVTFDGRELFRCPTTETTERLAATLAALVGDSFVVGHELGRRVVSFRVPGYGVAPRGWVCTGGTPQRTGRPR